MLPDDQAIEVKEGAYGLGLFLMEPAKEGDLIGGTIKSVYTYCIDWLTLLLEYVGEILSDRMTEARG